MIGISIRLEIQSWINSSRWSALHSGVPGVSNTRFQRKTES